MIGLSKFKAILLQVNPIYTQNGQNPQSGGFGHSECNRVGFLAILSAMGWGFWHTECNRVRYVELIG